MTADSPPSHSTLLGLLQEEIPFTQRPFAALANRCGLAEHEVIQQIRQLKADRVIRQISAIFDTRSLGYASSLVAAKISPDRFDEAVRVINEHPGVSHNYRRNHEFNLWYTIAVSPLSRFGLDATLERLHQLSGAEITRALPTQRLFKIGVRFDVEGSGRPEDQSKPSYTEANRKSSAPLTPCEVEFVRHMQQDLPIEEEPFVALARNMGVTFAEAAELHRQFLESGRMRRFAAVLHHRKAGFGANAMGVWAGPQDSPAELRRIGEQMAGFRTVSHCYQRPSYPDWPYNLFTMVHGKSEQECLQALEVISTATGITDYHALFSSHEFKKIRVRYFTPEEQAWEAR